MTTQSEWANAQANNYWSSTTYAGNTNNAWNVNMNDGNVNNNNKTNNNYVWPVRAGEWFCESREQGRCLPRPSIMGNAEMNVSFEQLYRQYLKCRRNKRNTINALAFEVNAEEKLLDLREELNTKTYSPSRAICFVVERPKMREIIAADFRDRVVHHVLIDRLEALYEPIFIHDSYACRKGKGAHKAVMRVREFIGKLSGDGGQRLFFMHLDIRNFFMTIDKDVLYDILKKKVTDEDMLVFYEFYEAAEYVTQQGPTLLGLNKLGRNKRKALHGFPVSREKEFSARLLEKGFSVVIIRETGNFMGRIKERLPREKLRPQRSLFVGTTSPPSLFPRSAWERDFHDAPRQHQKEDAERPHIVFPRRAWEQEDMGTRRNKRNS